MKDWNRFLDKNISQDENYKDVFDDDDDEALVTRINDHVSQKEEKFFLNDKVLVLNGTFTTFRKKFQAALRLLKTLFDKKNF